MIKRLKAFVLWLESRFPEKVVVTVEHYAALSQDVDRACSEITTWIGEVSAVKERMTALEYRAAHVDAVKDLVAVVKSLKDEVTALKANIGWDLKGAKAEEISAMLNGEVI